MPTTAEWTPARRKRLVNQATGDPFVAYLAQYSFNLARMKELQKTFKSAEDDPELLQRTEQWMTQTERLVKIVPTTWFGLCALVDVCLDKESIGEDDPLLFDAMKTIAKALKKLVPVERRLKPA